MDHLSQLQQFIRITHLNYFELLRYAHSSVPPLSSPHFPNVSSVPLSACLDESTRKTIKERVDNTVMLMNQSMKLGQGNVQIAEILIDALPDVFETREEMEEEMLKVDAKTTELRREIRRELERAGVRFFLIMREVEATRVKLSDHLERASELQIGIAKMNLER